jgi:hypothetical protein
MTVFLSRQPSNACHRLVQPQVWPRYSQLDGHPRHVIASTYLDNYASMSSKTASHKDLSNKSAYFSLIQSKHRQLICWQPPFLLMYRLHPGHLFASLLIIFSVFLSSSVGFETIFSPYCSQVCPTCHGTLCNEQELNPHALHVARFDGFRGSGSSGCSCPNEQPGPRHQRKFGSSRSRACRVLRSSYL